MFFTAARIAKSINALSDVHPFHGIAFLACKHAELALGRSVDFAMDTVTRDYPFLASEIARFGGRDALAGVFKTRQ